MDGLRPNMAYIWRDKTTRNVDEHFHYALATTLGNHVNMYRLIGPYQLHVTCNPKADRAFVSFL